MTFEIYVCSEPQINVDFYPADPNWKPILKGLRRNQVYTIFVGANSTTPLSPSGPIPTTVSYITNSDVVGQVAIDENIDKRYVVVPNVVLDDSNPPIPTFASDYNVSRALSYFENAPTRYNFHCALTFKALNTTQLGYNTIIYDDPPMTQGALVPTQIELVELRPDYTMYLILGGGLAVGGLYFARKKRWI